MLTVSTKQIVLHVDSTFSLSSGRVHSHVGDVLHISTYDGSDAVSEKPVDQSSLINHAPEKKLYGE